MKVLKGLDVEEFVQFTNGIQDNHWVLVEWNPDTELGVLPSVCAATADHLRIFQLWLLSQEEFVWTNEKDESMLVKSGLDVLVECTFYYDDNMIVLYQKLHELSGHYKGLVGVKYTFNNFVEDVARSCKSDGESASEESTSKDEDGEDNHDNECVLDVQDFTDEEIFGDDDHNGNRKHCQDLNQEDQEDQDDQDDQDDQEDQEDQEDQDDERTETDPENSRTKGNGVEPHRLFSERNFTDSVLDTLDMSDLTLDEPTVKNVLKSIRQAMYGIEANKKESPSENDFGTTLDIPDESEPDNKFSDFLSAVQVDFSNIKPFVLGKNKNYFKSDDDE